MVDKPDPQPIERKGFNIIVNGRQTNVDTDEVTFDEVVNLAYPNGGRGPYISYTVTYFNGVRPEEGGLGPTEKAKVKDGTVFNVTRTDRS